MGNFVWLSSADLPQQLDLQRKGWTLAARDADTDNCITLVDNSSLDNKQLQHLMAITPIEERRMMLVCRAEVPDTRAQLLANYFGDAIGSETSIEELEARADKLSQLAKWVPQRRVLAALEMDLLHREARFADKLINLHPREFALLWRLSDSPNETVSRETLIQDVWRLGFMPESNSVAVHISRLRSKLAAQGLKNLVETTNGGYRLRYSILNSAAPASWLGKQGEREVSSRMQ